MSVKMSETHTPVSSRETGLENLVEGGTSSHQMFIASPNNTLDTFVEFKSSESVEKLCLHVKDIPYFIDPAESVFGYTAITSKGKELYLSLSELEEGSAEVDFNSPLVPILNLCADKVSYQDLIQLEITQLRDMLGEKSQENKHLARQTQKFKRLALRDDLTGCLNANSYRIDQRRHMKSSIENKTVMFYLELDLTNLKMLNDIYGKKVGDEALEKLGTLMTKVFRRANRDFVYRFGGDEFAILIYDSNSEGVATRIEYFETELGKLQIKNPYFVEGEMSESDKYIKVAAEICYDKVSVGEMSSLDLRDQEPKWYNGTFAKYVKDPVGERLTIKKLGSTDPNMQTHIRTADYRFGNSSEARVINRTKKFLQEEVLN